LSAVELEEISALLRSEHQAPSDGRNASSSTGGGTSSSGGGGGGDGDERVGGREVKKPDLGLSDSVLPVGARVEARYGWGNEWFGAVVMEVREPEEAGGETLYFLQSIERTGVGSDQSSSYLCLFWHSRGRGATGVWLGSKSAC